MGNKTNAFSVMKKSKRTTERTHGQTLAIALSMLEKHNEVQITNKPKRVNSSEVSWRKL